MAVVPGINIGVGLLILIILWVATVLVSIALAAVPKARYAIPVVLVVTVIVTLVLIFYPRQGPGDNTADSQDVDELYFGRLVLLICLSLFVAAAVVAMFVFCVIEPVYAGSKRTFYVTS